MSDERTPAEPEVMEPTFWRKNGWTARVIKNEDDDGWAVEIRKQGLAEPVLISPWVMGRDKKNPKPFDATAFGGSAEHFAQLTSAIEVQPGTRLPGSRRLTSRHKAAADGLAVNDALVAEIEALR